MPKQGGFKRAVRQRARETGRAVHRGARRDGQAQGGVPGVRPVGRARAEKAHLEERYGIRITSMAPIVASGMTYSGTLRVDREVGPAWVVRVFSSPADTVSRVEGDAEILRFLARREFPAERLANDEAVSVLDGSGATSAAS